MYHCISDRLQLVYVDKEVRVKPSYPVIRKTFLDPKLFPNFCLCAIFTNFFQAKKLIQTFIILSTCKFWGEGFLKEKKAMSRHIINMISGEFFVKKLVGGKLNLLALSENLSLVPLMVKLTVIINLGTAFLL